MTPLPTLAEQRAAGLETRLSEALLAAVRDTTRALKIDRATATKRVHRKRRAE
jgi:hypothetical protein